MRLDDVVTEYVAYKRALGMRFNTDARTLTGFCHVVGDQTELEDVTEHQVNMYLAGKDKLFRSWRRNYAALKGLNRFVVGRAYAGPLPLPKLCPQEPQAFVPFVLTREEIRRLLDGVATHRKWRQFQPETFRSVLLLLYGAGLRISEALSLTLVDVDLPARVLTIRDTKFYKSRLVPIGPQLTQVVSRYSTWRREEGHSQRSSAPFFVLRSGTAVPHGLVRGAFDSLRTYVGICHKATGQRPRLHDFRHSFAVHRLVSWYRKGADVQSLLPHLVTYLGHIKLSSTQRYLTLTPELLQEASARFERYALSEVCHD
jgi:integrase/recombinase XerD